MKTLFLSLALSATALMAIPKTAVAQSADITQIKAVIERETTAFNGRDAAAFADCWANVPEASQLVIWQEPTGKNTIVSNRNTRQDMPTAAKAMIAGLGKPTGDTFQNADYQIRIKGDAAFAQYEQVVSKTDGKKEYAHETRYLEKTNGAWKIVHVGAVFYEPTK